MTLTALSVRNAWSHRRRMIGALLAVTIGVAFLSGTLLLGDTLRANFDDLFAQANGTTDVVVRSATKVSNATGRSDRATIDASLLGTVAAVDGVDAAVPYVEGYGGLVGKDGKVIGVGGAPTRAASWTTVPSLNPYRLVEGRAPEADDEVVVNRGAAKSGGLHVGDRTTLLTPEAMPVRIVGLATFGSADGFGSGTFVGVTLRAAEEHLTPDPSQLTTILVKASEGVDDEQLAARIRAALPPGVETITGDQLAAESLDQLDRGFLGLVRGGLLTFAAIALLVAALTIYNTFSIVTAQRTPDAALLRTLGASRRQVIQIAVVETIVVAIAGTVIGWLAGFALAALLKAAFDGFGFALPAGGLVVRAASAATAIGVGVAVTVAAGVAPAIRGSRVAPLAALREQAAEPVRVSRRRVAVGAAILGGGVTGVVAAVAGAGGPSGPIGALATLVGTVVLGPIAARAAMGVVGTAAMRARGIVAGLARRNALRNPLRTAATASALTVGIAIVSAFSVFGASLKSSAANGINQSLRADIVVDTPGYGGQSGSSGFSPRVAEAVAGVAGVDRAVELRKGTAVIAGAVHSVTALATRGSDAVLDLAPVRGSIGALSPASIAVSTSAADEHRWTIGSTVALVFPDGASETMTVGALYRHTDLVADYVMPLAAWAPHAGQAIDTQLLVRLRPGVDLSGAIAAVTDVAKPFGNPRVQSLDEYRASATSGVNTFLGLIDVMLVLAILIALMGIANTLSLSIHERTRELGVLRAIGQTRSQLRAMVRWESGMIALFGTTAGVAVGAFAGWGIVSAADSATLSVFSLPITQLLAFLVVGAIAGTLAGLRPASRAARSDVLAALAAE